MNNKFTFIKIRPSHGLILSNQGRPIGLIWMFRPDIEMKNRYWFENVNDSGTVLCIETGLDGYPVNCKQLYKNFDVPSGWENLSEEHILQKFEDCCHSLSYRKKNDEMQKLGGEIIEDMLSDRETK